MAIGLKIFGFLIIAALIGGCGSGMVVQRGRALMENTPPSAISPEGTPIYDFVGPTSQGGWDLRFLVIRAALNGLAYCVDKKIPDGLLAEIARIPIVILPDQEFSPYNLWGTTDLQTIFVSTYHLNNQTVRHEMLHNYFFRTQQGFFGDLFHRNPAFARSKCW